MSKPKKGKQKNESPTDREVRLRFILLAVIDTASVCGVSAELLLSAHKLLREPPGEAQLLDMLAQILATDDMQGFRLAAGSEADELLQSLELVAIEQ